MFQPSITTQVLLSNGTRVITNRCLEEILGRLLLTEEEKAKIRPILTGGHEPRFLLSKGLEFEIHIRKIPKGMKPEVMEKFLVAQRDSGRRSSFSFVEGGSVTILYAWKNGQAIHTWADFAKAVDIKIANGEKLNKRLNELVRLTPYFADLSHCRVRIIEDDYPNIPQEYVDGVSIVAMRVALAMAPDPATRKKIHDGDIRRVIFRALTPDGLVKGDGLIVPNSHMPKGCDVYTSRHNVKPELSSTGPRTVTMEPHHGSSPVWTDGQTTSWFPELFPLEQLEFATKTLLNNVLDDLVDGKYPAFMTRVPRAKEVDQVAVVKSLSQRWTASGLGIDNSAALMALAGGAVKNQLLPEPPMEPGKDGKLRPIWDKQKFRAPVVWAFYGHMMTDTIIKLAGYKIPAGAEGKLFYHPETHSVVIPAEHFARYYRHHGGWDLDDSARIFLRRIDGELKAIIIRSPNAWGEYSVIDVHIDGLPLYFKWGQVPELASADLPTQIDKLAVVPRNRKIPSDNRVLGAVYSVVDFDYALDCAVINPGTGSAINLTCIAPNSMHGDYERDPIADTEDIVDLTQAKPNRKGLEYLTDELAKRKQGLMDEVASGAPIDPLIFARRLNLTALERQDLRREANFVEGFPSQLKAIIFSAITDYKAKLKALSIGMRVQFDFSGLDFRPVDNGVQKIWKLYCAAVDDTMRSYDAEFKRQRWANLNRRLVAGLLNNEEDRRDLILLGLLNQCYKKGQTDTVVFLTPFPGEDSVMDLLIEALDRHGFIQ